jgi:hypothetical protein
VTGTLEVWTCLPQAQASSHPQICQGRDSYGTQLF